MRRRLSARTLAVPDMEAIDAVLRKWRDEVRLNPPATEADLARLEHALGRTLPPDVRHYFSIANGMEDGEAADESLTNFWSIEKMTQDPWRPSGTDALGPYRDLAFADVLINSWFICFRVRPAAGVAVHVEGALLELPSLDAFFRQYLDDPHSLCIYPRSQSAAADAGRAVWKEVGGALRSARLTASVRLS